MILIMGDVNNVDNVDNGDSEIGVLCIVLSPALVPSTERASPPSVGRLCKRGSVYRLYRRIIGAV
jgi:hypothetical protein